MTFPSSLGSKTRVRKRFSDDYETPLSVRHERALPTFYIILLFSVNFCHLLQNEAAVYFFKSSILGAPANRNPVALAGLLAESVGGWEPPRSAALVKRLK